MIELRPRQAKAIADVRAAFASGHRAPVLVAPTGAGKTFTAIEIVRLSISRGHSVWFLAHLREILDDTSARLTAAGIGHGSIRAGRSSGRGGADGGAAAAPAAAGADHRR
ncbi:MAG: hypothetical protein EBS91_04335 [Betaproteobacteria bacterium]|nr:hypothetical protein [Betaproteobacteria bacterium]